MHLKIYRETCVNMQQKGEQQYTKYVDQCSQTQGKLPEKPLNKLKLKTLEELYTKTANPKFQYSLKQDLSAANNILKLLNESSMPLEKIAEYPLTRQSLSYETSTGDMLKTKKVQLLQHF